VLGSRPIWPVGRWGADRYLLAREARSRDRTGKIYPKLVPVNFVRRRLARSRGHAQQPRITAIRGRLGRAQSAERRWPSTQTKNFPPGAPVLGVVVRLDGDAPTAKRLTAERDARAVGTSEANDASTAEVVTHLVDQDPQRLIVAGVGRRAVAAGFYPFATS
jgi:hypothetical protein